MKKVETHLHVAPIGSCAIETPRDAVRLYKNVGYDVIICTNHFHSSALNDISADGKDPVAEYLRAYRELKKYGEKAGIDVWLGAEVRLEDYDNMEFLLYGIDENFIIKNSDMIHYTQEELYNKCHEVGAIIVQSHPQRKSSPLCNLDFVDGLEAYNLNPQYTASYVDFLPYALSTGKILLSGSDFHFRGGEGLGGMSVPDLVDNIADFVDALKNGTATPIIPEGSCS